MSKINYSPHVHFELTYTSLLLHTYKHTLILVRKCPTQLSDCEKHHYVITPPQPISSSSSKEICENVEL